jgi:hypothetical protein
MVSVGGGKSGPPQLRPLLPNPDVISARLGEEIVLVHLRTDRFYELNGTAARFWELLSTGCDSAQINRQLLEEFAVDPNQLADETKRLLMALQEQDLVTHVE